MLTGMNSSLVIFIGNRVRFGIRSSVSYGLSISCRRPDVSLQRDELLQPHDHVDRGPGRDEGVLAVTDPDGHSLLGIPACIRAVHDAGRDAGGPDRSPAHVDACGLQHGTVHGTHSRRRHLTGPGWNPVPHGHVYVAALSSVR